MSSQTLYLLDANILITAARYFYNFDFGNNFWDFLVQKAEDNIIKGIDKIYDEIMRGNDRLKEWAKTDFFEHFLDTTEAVVWNNYLELMKWVGKQKGKYTQNAINIFTKENNADPWLIAYAMKNKRKFIIVTFERKVDNIKRKIPIPNVCEEFSIEYCNLYQMLKNLKFRF
jgi:hypothetical protein